MARDRPERPSGAVSLRALAKRIAEQALLNVSGPFVRQPGGARLLLAYHNVVPDELAGIGDASLHLPVSSFRAQLALRVARQAASLGRPALGMTTDCVRG